MARKRVQCPYCGGDVEIFVEGTITDVKRGSEEPSGAAGFIEGISIGVDEERGLKTKHCPYCDNKMSIRLKT